VCVVRRTPSTDAHAPSEKIMEGRKRGGQKIMKVIRGSLKNKGNNKRTSKVS